MKLKLPSINKTYYIDHDFSRLDPIGSKVNMAGKFVIEKIQDNYVYFGNFKNYFKCLLTDTYKLCVGGMKVL